MNRPVTRVVFITQPARLLQCGYTRCVPCVVGYCLYELPRLQKSAVFVCAICAGQCRLSDCDCEMAADEPR